MVYLWNCSSLFYQHENQDVVRATNLHSSNEKKINISVVSQVCFKMITCTEANPGVVRVVRPNPLNEIKNI